MSVTTEGLRTPKIRIVHTHARRRGGRAIVAIAVVLVTLAALLLLWPRSVEGVAGPAGRVEAAAEQANQIWIVNPAQVTVLADEDR